MAASAYFRSFSSGELSKTYASRADLPTFSSGLRTCRNFIVARDGGALNRGGTRFVAGVKLPADDKTRMIAYVHETPGESMLIEFGIGYLRFYLNGALVVIVPGDFPAYDNVEAYTPGRVVTSGGLFYICVDNTTGNAPPNVTFWTQLTAQDADGSYIYEVPTPFNFPLETKAAQSGRVITFTHQSVRPRDLTFISADYWQLEQVTTVAQAATPQNPTVAQSANEVDLTYFVRAVAGVDAGPPSVEFSDTFAPPSVDSPITITWDAPSGGAAPDYYEVFKGGQFLGATSATTFDDVGQPLGDPWSPGTGGGIVDPPENVAATQPAVVPDTSTFRYVVTAIVAGEESFASDVATEDLEDPTPDRPHNIGWDAVADATAYNVYADPNNNGVFGFIGTSASNGFNYPGTPTPDYAHNPPTDSNFFSGSDFPACVGYFQQRRVFGNRPSAPDGVQGSRVGLPNNFTVSTPLQDSDAITFRLRGKQQHAVRALINLKDLIVMTDDGGWRSKLAPGEPLTPSNLPFDQEIYIGIDPLVDPVVVGNALVYVQARGRKVNEVKFAQPVEGLAGRDLTLFATHLFDDFTLRAMDYAHDPHSIVWACRSDGTLLGMTYIPELDAVGWHRHDSAAAAVFEDVCVVPELNADSVYVIVKRTINGATTRSIERLTARREAVFMDAAVVYSGAPVSSLSGLGHLEGELVAIFADGQDRTPATVNGGAVALGASYASVKVGLPIEADVELLDLDAPGSTVRSRKKSIPAVQLLLEASTRNFRAGPDVAGLVAYQAPSSEDPTNRSFSGLVELVIKARQELSPRVFIRHDKPTPLAILGVLPDVEVGG